MLKPRQLPEEVCNLLKERLYNEYDAHYTYRAVSNWLQNKGFSKASAYFAKEAEDELKHAEILQKYIVDWNDTPTLPTIQNIPTEFKNLVDVIEIAYKKETELYDLYIETAKEIFDMNELGSYQFLQQFIQIQNDSVIEFSDMFNLLEGVNTEDKFQLLKLEEDLFGE